MAFHTRSQALQLLPAASKPSFVTFRRGQSRKSSKMELDEATWTCRRHPVRSPLAFPAFSLNLPPPVAIDGERKRTRGLSIRSALGFLPRRRVFGMPGRFTFGVADLVKFGLLAFIAARPRNPHNTTLCSVIAAGYFYRVSSSSSWPWLDFSWPRYSRS
jgi:hypothetical protein